MVPVRWLQWLIPAWSRALVNDLALEVVSPSGQVYRGNDFTSPFNDAFDRLNNAENIRINNPEPGVYTVRVSGYNIPVGPQDYSLVITGDFINQLPPAPSQPPAQPGPPAPQPGPREPKVDTSASALWTGKVTSKGSLNYYLDLTAPGTLTAKLAWASSADLDLYLYDPKGTLVAKANGSGKLEAITLGVVNQGRYRLRVKSFTGSAEFTLSANHPIDPAKTVIDTAQGSLDSAANKTTTHSITVGGPGVINIEVGWNNAAGDFDLYLYNPSGQQVAKATSGKLNPETISYPVSAAGAYSLKILAYSGKADYNLKVIRPK